MLLAKNTAYGVYDFWDEKYLGKHTDDINIIVPPLGIKVLRIFKYKTYPFIISTNMHVTQGAVELLNVEWDEKSYTLKGTAVRSAGETGAVIVSLPEGWIPSSYRGINVARSELHDESFIYKSISFESKVEHFSLNFKHKAIDASREGEAGRM